MSEEKATCRNCGKEFVGKPYHLGGTAYDNKTMERIPVNQYGGFVCSETCDIAVCIEVEGSMPGNTGHKLTSLSTYSQQKIKQNWRTK